MESHLKKYGIRQFKLSTLLVVALLFAVSTSAQEKDFSHVPGNVVSYSPPESGIYLGSPSIVVLPDGTYIASHDYFGKKMGQISIYESNDLGNTWQKISDIKGFWSGLFVHNDDLYLMGVDEKYGNAVIRKSTDGGHSWTSPDDSESGLIRPKDVEKGFHTSAVSLIVANGRIWRPYEVAPQEGRWGNFEAVVFSAPVDADLLDAKSWTTSTRMAVDTAWGKEFGTWLEGGAVLSQEGHVLNILRVNNREEEYAAIVHVSDDGRNLSFHPEKDFIRFPGGCKRFVIRYDKKSKRYWSLSNWIPEEFKGHNIERTRNTLALVSSDDLRNWTVHSVILQDNNVEKSGFQYVDWQFENDDIIFLSRTAFFDGENYADNQHNSNFITFHRIEEFRKNIKNTLEIIKNKH
jgi:hypothetical protein